MRARYAEKMASEPYISVEQRSKSATVTESKGGSHESLEEFYKAYLDRANAATTVQPGFFEWERVNALQSSATWGTFNKKEAEEVFASAQSLYADKSISLFLRVFLVVVFVPVGWDFTRRNSEFDIGEFSRLFRLVVFTFTSAVVIACLWMRRKNKAFFVTMSESSRVALVLIFCNIWFLVFPPVHGILFGVPWKGVAKVDVMVVWTFVLLHLTIVGSCSAFKLRFTHSCLMISLATLQSSFIFAQAKGHMPWDRVQGATLWIFAGLFNVVILRIFDFQNRRRFLAVAHRYEMADRVMSMARRLRAAQAFASSSWKADNSVVALKRIRDDPAMQWDRSGRAILELGISSFSFALDNPSSAGFWTKWRRAAMKLDSDAADTSTSRATQLSMSDSPTRVGMHRRDPSLGNNVLETYMGDWNFGSKAGIWTHLSAAGLAEFRAQPLVTAMLTALDGLEFFDGASGFCVPRTMIARFIAAIETAYLPRSVVPYHNALHAVDVLQTVYAMYQLDSEALGRLPRLAVFSLLLGAAIHDVGHPGVNNAHLIARANDVALTYNDRSVLENFHVSKSFSIMNSSPDVNIMQEFIAQDRRDGTQLARTFRNLVIDMVLATDLTHHFENKARLRARLSQQLDFADVADTALVCSSLLHAADVSNVAKTWLAYEPWIDLLFAEFFAQGDAEKALGLPVPPFMDREVSVPEKAQMAFITNIVLPMYVVLSDFVPSTARRAVDHMNENLAILDRRSRERDNNTRSREGSIDTLISQKDDDGSVASGERLRAVQTEDALDGDAETSGEE